MLKAVDCADVLRMGHNISGVYEIWPMSRVTEGKSLDVYCDMETDRGGWTVSLFDFYQRLLDFRKIIINETLLQCCQTSKSSFILWLQIN